MRGRFLVIPVVLVTGCTLLTSVGDLKEAPNDAGPTSTLDANEKADSTISTADVTAPSIDAGPSNDGTIDVDATLPPNTAVSCSQPATCPKGHGCCVVYGPVEDFCVDITTPASCASDAGRSVLVPCDDETDCAALGFPGTICCGTLPPTGGFGTVSCVPANQCTGVQLCDAQLKKCPTGKNCVTEHAADIWSCEFDE